jgi:hypothetical protein
MAVEMLRKSTQHYSNLPEMSNVQYVQVRAICKEWNKITEKPTETAESEVK